MPDEKPAELSLRQFNPLLADAMDELRRIPAPRIQENIFLKRWLPLFSDLTPEEKDHIDDPRRRRPMMHWVQNVSLKSTNAVDVYDGDTFLYQVPPLHRDIVFDFRKQNPAYDLSGEVAIAGKKAAILPALGDEHLRERVTKVVLPPFVLDETAARAWNIIFARYSLPLILLTDDLKTAAVAPMTQIEDGDDEPLIEL